MQVFKRLLIQLLMPAGCGSLVFASSARADGDLLSTRPYGFSGVCSSQGLWTQDALQLTQQIRNFTLQLRDDPNCKALGNRVQASLAGLADKVRSPVEERHARNISQLPQELSALWTEFRSNVNSGSSPRPLEKLFTPNPRLNRAIFQKTLQSAVISLRSAAEGPIGERFAAASRDGLTLFNDVVEAMPQMEQCLTGDGVAAGQLVATSVKLLTSFVASGQDQSGNTIASALSKLTHVMRDMKFAGILKKLNQADFLASMACLVEMSTENYCTTRDSKMLFDDMLKQLQTRPRDAEQRRLGQAHPLAGYYILTQNVPLISQWIQRVQIGVDPRVPTDADFQNQVFDEVNSFFKKIKDLQGMIGKDVEAMKIMTDKRSKQGAARQLISRIFHTIVSASANEHNFFTASRSETLFLLLGIPMPNEVSGANGAVPQTPDQWLENNYMNLGIFNDPDELVRRAVEYLEKEMITQAKTNAVLYYNKWFIVDKISLVNESLLGVNFNVKESLILTDSYLGEVEKRIRAFGKDLTMIGGLRETRAKIQNVLKAYAEVENVSRELASRDSANLSDDDRSKVLNTNVAVITSVYKEFEVLLAKSGWFQNRIKDFVLLDNQILLQQQNQFSQNINDWGFAAGLSIFDKLVAMSSNNPALVQNDLSTALRLNKMNLEAVEALIKDYFVATTVELQAVAKASKGDATFNDKAIVTDGPSRARRDYLTKLPGEKEDSAAGAFARKLYAGGKFWIEAAANIPLVGGVFGERKYEKQGDRFAFDDEFGSARRLYEQFCIQSLAFSDVRPFYTICQNAVLKSPFPESFLAQLSEEERKPLSVKYKEKLMESRENAALNYSKRICAFRDYNRKNLVTYLTSAKGNRP